MIAIHSCVDYFVVFNSTGERSRSDKFVYHVWRYSIVKGLSGSIIAVV